MSERDAAGPGVAARPAAAGVVRSIDDFATGYSSLVRLRTSRLNEIKIDWAFVAEIRTGRPYAHAGGGHGGHGQRGLRVVAEGVEIEGQAKALRCLACDKARAHLHVRPGPILCVGALGA